MTKSSESTHLILQSSSSMRQMSQSCDELNSYVTNKKSQDSKLDHFLYCTKMCHGVCLCMGRCHGVCARASRPV